MKQYLMTCMYANCFSFHVVIANKIISCVIMLKYVIVHINISMTYESETCVYLCFIMNN